MDGKSKNSQNGGAPRQGDKMIDKMAWLDLETTGLDPDKDGILEIGIVITDTNLNQITSWGHTVMPPQSAWEHMNDFVRDMHTKNGLLKQVQEWGGPTDKVEQEALSFARQFFERREVPLCGSTISFDRSFLTKHMPELNEFFHYRSIDVSSIKELAKLWYPGFPEQPKKESHRSVDDALESAELLRYYRRLFRDPNEDCLYC